LVTVIPAQAGIKKIKFNVNKQESVIPTERGTNDEESKKLNRDSSLSPSQNNL